MALDVDVQGFFRLGEQLAQAHDDRNALRVFRRYTQLAPEDAHGWANRAAVAARLGVLNEQEPCLLRAIALAPNSPHYRVRLGYYLVGRARLDEAEALFASVTGPMASCGLARVYEARGEPMLALEALVPWIHLSEQHPQLGVTFSRLSRELGHPEEGLAVLEALPPLPIVLFEMGHCLDALGHYSKAWVCFLKANELVHRPFDAEAWQARLEAERRAPRSNRAEVDGSNMIFIVGMPRSGTSLVEQILSRHPKVCPLGEREIFPRIARQLALRGWPDLSTPELNNLAQRVYEGLNSGDSLYIDKMPDNWQHMALIRQVLPGARFIHCRRDARDCLLSNFMQHYHSSEHAWSSSIQGLGSYYQGYVSADVRAIDLRYEELASHPEATIGRLLEELGLTCCASCLHPEQSTRRIATASYLQVQKPIYTSSIGRSEHYRNLMAA